MGAEGAAGEPPATHRFREVLMTRDFDAMRQALAPDVLLNSPILSTPFEGREAVVELFRIIADTLEDIRFTVDVAEGDLHFMSWECRVGAVDLEGAEIL